MLCWYHKCFLITQKVKIKQSKQKILTHDLSWQYIKIYVNLTFETDSYLSKPIFAYLLVIHTAVFGNGVVASFLYGELCEYSFQLNLITILTHFTHYHTLNQRGGTHWWNCGKLLRAEREPAYFQSVSEISFWLNSSVKGTGRWKKSTSKAYLLAKL